MVNSTIDELKKLVLIAQKETADRLKKYSEYGPSIHAKSQLSFIKNKLDNLEPVNEDEKKINNQYWHYGC